MAVAATAFSGMIRWHVSENCTDFKQEMAQRV
jgi:hypothetical protein